MSTLFRGGPANDVALSLSRAPRFLRVTRGPHGWDALDQLEDSPEDNEKLFAYEIEGEPMRAFFRPGGLRMVAHYRWIEKQPSDAEMRETDRWQAWCLASAALDRPPQSGPNLPP